MAMWKLKGCIRCGGDVFIDRDEYGWYEGCLGCGYRSELVIPTKRYRPIAGKKKESAVAAHGKN